MRARIVENEKVRTLTDAEEIKAALIAQTPIWVELEAQCEEANDLLTNCLDIHPLTIEDIWQTRTQPKLEDYRTYLYMIVHGVKSARRGVFDLLELDVIIGKTFLITHDPHGVSSKEVLEELDRDPSLLLKGPAWVAHSLLDHAVDHYLPIVDQLDTQLENLIDDSLSKAGTKHGNAVMKRILRYKRTLQTLRRMSVLQREIFLRLSRGEFEEIPRETVPFFRDVYDHFLRINDLIESYRDLVTSALEAYLSVQSNRMNEVMKTLTMISTVMLPLTFIAGLYGMNFKHMPELEWVLGYPFALVLMAVVSAGILMYFRHKGWLGGGSDDELDVERPTTQKAPAPKPRPSKPTKPKP
jgi:magnesium transporter